LALGGSHHLGGGSALRCAHHRCGLTDQREREKCAIAPRSGDLLCQSLETPQLSYSRVSIPSMGRRTYATLIAMGLIAAVPAGQAAADPGDANFVSQLSRAGITITDPPSLVGNTGRTICSLLQADWTVGTASYSAMSEYPDLSEGQARNFVLIAQRNYCPDTGSSSGGGSDDASFVGQLSQAGIWITDPPSLVGNTARTICSLLQADWTVGTASYSVLSEYPSLSESQARNFVLLSQKNYCPDA
jgi:hypothetical protein